MKGLYQHTNSTAQVEIVFDAQLLVHGGQSFGLPVIVKLYQSEKFQWKLTIP
jgi:hypothetical protein